MPAIQSEYDEFNYIARRTRGTVNTAPSVSDSKISKKRVAQTSKKKATSKNAVAQKTTKNVPRPKVTNVSTARMAAAKKANKESVRAVMRDNAVTKSTARTGAKTTTRVTSGNRSRTATSTTTTKRKATHNLDVPNINKKTGAQKPKEMSLKKADLMKSPKQKANEKTLKKENVIKNTATLLCAFSLLLLICYRSSVINESFQALGTLKSNLEDTYTLNAQLESDIQTQTDISNIETYAKYQLGMQKPKESQIQKVYVQKEDRIATPVVIEEEEKSFWDNLINDLLNLID